MDQEENVYGDTTLTEDVKTDNMGAEEHARLKNASTVLGKFKDVDALARAYSALQAEFTRRSQRLKELERQAENFKAEKAFADGFGVEKLRKNAKVKRAEAKRFDRFMADVVADAVADKTAKKNAVDAKAQEEKSDVPSEIAAGEAAQTAVELDAPENGKPEGICIADAGAENGRASMTEDGRIKTETAQSADGGVGVAMPENAGLPVANHGETVLSSERLYEKVLGDEKVRLRIIGEYLASIGKSGAPVTFGNAGVFAAPPVKARSIADAGGMALHYFKTKPDGTV